MNRFALAVIALLIGQSLFLGAMVWDRVSLLRSGDVVTLRTAPVDPRDIFRGDYVILNYDISRLHIAELGSRPMATSGRPSRSGAHRTNRRRATSSSVAGSTASSAKPAPPAFPKGIPSPAPIAARSESITASRAISFLKAKAANSRISATTASSPSMSPSVRTAHPPSSSCASTARRSTRNRFSDSDAAPVFGPGITCGHFLRRNIEAGDKCDLSPPPKPHLSAPRSSL